MERIEEILSRREHVASLYRSALQNIPGIQLPAESSGQDRISWFVYVVRVAPGHRDRIAATLIENGVQCGRYFAPIHGQPAYAGWPLPHALPVTERESARTLALPFFSTMTEAQVKYVAGQLRQALG